MIGVGMVDSCKGADELGKAPADGALGEASGELDGSNPGEDVVVGIDPGEDVVVGIDPGSGDGVSSPDEGREFGDACGNKELGIVEGSIIEAGE
jgi:hypothetical protein